MEVSGEVADLLVKEGLQVAELAAKLSGKGVVNVAVLVAALIKNNYKVVGEVGVARLNRENVESVIVPVKQADFARFQELAKRFGVLYAAVRNEDVGKDIQIISNVNYSAQLNAVLEALGYCIPTAGKEEQAAKKAKPRAPQEKSSGERGTGWRSTGSNERPSVREKLEHLKAAAETINAPQWSRGKDKTR